MTKPPLSRLDTRTAVVPGRSHQSTTIHAAGLECSFGSGDGTTVHALGPLDLDVRDGEFLCVVGPSGCGKSTFVRMIAGLHPPTGGELTLRPFATGGTTIATVFQDFAIFPWKTVRGNVELALRAGGSSRTAARAVAADWLGRLGLEGFADAYPATLSGGMRQRVAIARALAVEPEILLMDEPFAALDAQLREILQEELLALSQSSTRTVVFVTHSLEEAIVLGDRVVVMTARPGRILDEIVVPFPRPRDAEVRRSAEFTQLRERLWGHLRSEVQGQFARRKGDTP